MANKGFQPGNKAAAGRRTGKRWDEVERRVALLERVTSCLREADAMTCIGSSMHGARERLVAVAKTLLDAIEPAGPRLHDC